MEWRPNGYRREELFKQKGAKDRGGSKVDAEFGTLNTEGHGEHREHGDRFRPDSRSIFWIGLRMHTE
jgi:hypothetical protein